MSDRCVDGILLIYVGPRGSPYLEQQLGGHGMVGRWAAASRLDRPGWSRRASRVCVACWHAAAVHRDGLQRVGIVTPALIVALSVEDTSWEMQYS